MGHHCGGMEIETRVTRWAETACTLLDATRTVLVAARRLVITATLLATALAGLVTAVVYLLP